MKKQTTVLGFTLIEIMVVVTISMILVGMGLAQYNDFRKRQELIRSAENFATELREVQKKADIGQRVGCNFGNPGITGKATLVGYKVAFDSATGPEFQVFELCDDDDSTPANPKELASRPIYLRDDIQIVNGINPVANWEVQFNVLAPQNESSQEVFVLRNAKNDLCIRVNISALGDISVEDGSVGACPI